MASITNQYALCDKSQKYYNNKDQTKKKHCKNGKTALFEVIIEQCFFREVERKEGKKEGRQVEVVGVVEVFEIVKVVKVDEIFEAGLP